MSGNTAKKITLEEEVTIYNADEVKQKLFDQLLINKSVVIEMSGVAELDTAGLQAILFGKRYAEKHNLNVSIESPSDAVVEVFDLYGIGELLEKKS